MQLISICIYPMYVNKTSEKNGLIRKMIQKITIEFKVYEKKHNL